MNGSELHPKSEHNVLSPICHHGRIQTSKKEGAGLGQGATINAWQTSDLLPKLNGGRGTGNGKGMHGDYCQLPSLVPILSRPCSLLQCSIGKRYVTDINEMSVFVQDSLKKIVSQILDVRTKNRNKWTDSLYFNSTWLPMIGKTRHKNKTVINYGCVHRPSVKSSRNFVPTRYKQFSITTEDFDDAEWVIPLTVIKWVSIIYLKAKCIKWCSSWCLA